MSQPLPKNKKIMLFYLESFALFLLLLALVVSYQSKSELLNIWGSKCQSNGNIVPATRLAIVLAIAALASAFTNIIFALANKKLLIGLALFILFVGFAIAGVFIWLNAMGGMCFQLAG